MAKKKTIDLRNVDPTPVPEGDVNIIYNGTRIGGFSEDTEATLKTGGTRVLHDIDVNYTKPAAPAGDNYVHLTIEDTATAEHTINTDTLGILFNVIEGNIQILDGGFDRGENAGIIPIYSSRGND